MCIVIQPWLKILNEIFFSIKYDWLVDNFYTILNEKKFTFLDNMMTYYWIVQNIYGRTILTNNFFYYRANIIAN